MAPGRRLPRRTILLAGALAAAGCTSGRRRGTVCVAEPREGLQPAIDRVQAGGGGTVEVPAGSVFLERSVVIPTSVDLEIRGSLVRAPGSGHILIAVPGDGCRVRGFPGGVLDGNRYRIEVKADAVRVTGSGCTLSGLTIRDSASNGIAIFSGARNLVESCDITNSRDNGIIVANRGADGNVLRGNRIRGTDDQNGIFLTASAGSTPTPDAIHGNQVIDNDVSEVGDAGVETGIHTVDTVIAGVSVTAGRNPGILLRDCVGVQVRRSTVYTTPETLDAIAVVPQTEPPTGPVASTFTDCAVVGNAERSGFYIGSPGVSIRRPRLLRGGVAGVRGTAFVVGAVDDVEVLEPTTESWPRAFMLNYPTTEAVLRNLRVLAPTVDRVDELYTALGAHLVDCLLDVGRVGTIGRAVFERNDRTTLEGATRVGPVPAGALAPGADPSLPPTRGR